MLHVQFSTTVNQIPHRIHITGNKFLRVVLQPFKECSVLDKGNFYCFRGPGSPFAIRQCGQEIVIVEDRYRCGKRSKKILLSEEIDSVFHTYSGIVLTKYGSRNPDMADTAVCHSSGISGYIKTGTSTDSHKVRMTVDTETFNRFNNPIKRTFIVLYLFTPGKD